MTRLLFAVCCTCFLVTAGADEVRHACQKISGKLASVSYNECETLDLQPSGFSSVDGFPLLVKEYPPLEARKPRGAQIAPHIYCGPIAHAAAAHVSFASPNFLILETIRSGFHDAVLRKPLRWEEGYLVAPDEPGLGIELDEQAVRDHPYTTGGRLHLEMCRTPLGSNNTKIVTELDG